MGFAGQNSNGNVLPVEKNKKYIVKKTNAINTTQDGKIPQSRCIKKQLNTNFYFEGIESNILTKMV